jgi:hypothetical protein
MIGILALTICLVSFLILALGLFRHILDHSEVSSIPVSSAKLLRRRYDPRL